MGTMATAASGPVYRVEKSRTWPIIGAFLMFMVMGLSLAVFYLAYLNFTAGDGSMTGEEPGNAEDPFIGGVVLTVFGIVIFTIAFVAFHQMSRPYIKKGYIRLSLERVQYFEKGVLKTEIAFNPSVMIEISHTHWPTKYGYIDGYRFISGDEVLDVSNFTGYEIEDLHKLRDFVVRIVLHNRTKVGKRFIEYAKAVKMPHPGATPPGR